MTAQDKQEQDGPTQGKKELLDQLRGRRKEVERLMAKRRADREGITVAVSLGIQCALISYVRGWAQQQYEEVWQFWLQHVKTLSK